MTAISITRNDNLGAMTTRLHNEVDARAGEIRAAYASVGELLAQEYELARVSAEAFEAAGYTGAAPAPVQDWADITGMTAQAAAEDILATRDQWMYALTLIRRERLAGKAAISAAADARTKLAAQDTALQALEALRP